MYIFVTETVDGADPGIALDFKEYDHRSTTIKS